MSEKVIIFGLGKMAQLAWFYLTHDSRYEVAGFTVDRDYITEQSFCGLPVVPFESVTETHPPAAYKMYVAVGYTKLNSIRRIKYYEAKEKGYTLISYLSSKATHWGDTKIGDNTFIMENQVIQPFVTIGDNVIIWSGNHFGHDVVVENHVFMASHIVASGGVSIGESSFVGVNVTIRDNITVGRECIIGAGAVILRNTKDKEVYVAKSTEPYPLDSERFERMMEISRKS